MIYTPPEQVLGNLLLINVFMVLVGIGLAAMLAVYVARSVSQPLERLRTAMERVSGGELTVRLPVQANDELGRVTEGFNEMVEALAEKEASIRELTQGLEDKVHARTQELSAALEEKERTQAQLVQSKKMASLGLLVAGVAHEINNPVGYIYANSDHMERFLSRLEEAFEKGDAEAFHQAKDRLDKLVQATQEGAKRAKEIVQSLSTFSRRDPAARRRVDVREVLENALMLLSHHLKRGVTVTRDYQDTPPITANPGELSQVFLNIILNALQAMSERKELLLATRHEDGQVRVSIRDTGSGIRPEDLEHLFEPFFTTKDVGEGTGLGLSIAYGIVKAHAGEIKVTSEVGQGTTVEINLPVEM
jgi:signal transduction histidine kinase